MIASRAKGRPAAQVFPFGLAAAFALVLGPPIVSAQSIPSETAITAEPLAPPTPLLPFDPSPRRPQGVDPTADAPSVQGIEINPLAAVEPDALGLLEPSEGGFGKDMWAGTDRAVVEALVPRLPDRYRSAVLRDLARRLLLSRAAPPQRFAERRLAQADVAPDSVPGAAIGAANAGEADADEPDLGLLALRVDRLAAVGDTEALSRFLDIVPRRYDEEPIARARIDTAMLNGAVEDGCREVQNGMRLYFSLPYWQKALIYCQLAAGQTGQAQLGIGLLRETGQADDAGFQAMVEALSGGTESADAESGDADSGAEVPPALAAKPLPFALLQARGRSLPAESVATADLGVLVAMAKSSKTRIELRAAAAETAVALGALAPKTLAAAYARFDFDVEDLAGPPDALPALADPRLRALAYQRIEHQATPEARAAALVAALRSAWSEAEGYRALALALQPALRKLSPTPQQAELARDAGRALYVAGKFESATAWRRAAETSAAADASGPDGAKALWPYWRLAGGRADLQQADLDAWKAARPDAAQADRQAEFLQAAFSALDSAEAPTLADLTATASRAAQDAGDPDLLFDLAAAAAAQRRGEVVLRSLLLLAPGDLAEVTPAMLKGVLSALKDVGLELEARALAIETALAKRI